MSGCGNSIPLNLHPGQLYLPNEVRHLFLDFQWIDQRGINHILGNMSQLRYMYRVDDVYSHVSAVAPLILIANHVAVSFNRTLLSVNNSPRICINESSFFSFDKTISKIANSGSRALLTPVGEEAFNFGYCKLRKTQVDVSPLEIFRSTADPLVWVCLALSFVFTCVLEKAASSRKLSSVLLSLASVLLSPGPSCVSHSSKLFLVWMFFCLVFGTYYSGNLTSVVISPAPDERFTRIEQFGSDSYKFIIPSVVMLTIRNKTLDIAQQWRRKYVDSQLQRKFKVFKKMLSSAEVYAPYNYSWQDRFIKGSEKIVYFSSFFSVATFINQIEKLLDTQNVTSKRCYIGEVLELPDVTYFLLVSPELARFWRILQVFIEAGFTDRLVKEFYLGMTFTRIQERYRSISLTKWVEEVAPLGPLRMSDGKLNNVFLLWIVCLTVAVVGITVEIIKFALFRKKVDFLKNNKRFSIAANISSN